MTSGPDRLPWLTEVPRIAPDPPAPKKERWEFPWGAVLIGLAFAFVAVAAYYLGIRKAVEDSAEPTAPLEQPYEPQPAAPTADEPLAETLDAPVAEQAEVPVLRPQAAPGRPQPRPIRESGQPQAEAGGPAVPQEAQPTPVIVQPVVRGRIIQLGAYPTSYQAEVAWQQLVKTWPYLATKPKLVSPIDVRSTDGKATRMHRLQLATASQAQSVVICQQLEKRRQSCAVVY